MSTKYPMRLRRLVEELTTLLARHGDVDVVMETEVKGGIDEHSVNRIETFRLNGTATNPIVVALCAKEVEL